MKTESYINPLKSILLFGLISIVIDLIRNLTLIRFQLIQLFEMDFLTYQVFLEYVIVVITALGTHFVSKSFVNNGLTTSLIKATIFGIIYGIICLISHGIIILITGGGSGFHLDIYNSFIKFIPNGLMEGFLFLFVLVMLQYKSKNKDTIEHTHNSR
jgi:hypothetical protein